MLASFVRQLVANCEKLFEELEDLEKNGITVEVDDLAAHGIVWDDADELQQRGIEKLENGNYAVHFDVKVLVGGDLKFLVALWGLSSCSATTPCPWCLIFDKDFGNFDAEIIHRCVV